MREAYNFLASWQLFPEKGKYEYGERPKSGIYKIESAGDKLLSINQNRVTLENVALSSSYRIAAQEEIQPFENTELAEQARVVFKNSIQLEISFYKKGITALHIVHEIMPNGYLKITQHGKKGNGEPYTNTEFYHKQLRVLPYSASVGSAVIKPTEEGLIKHKALTVMEEQTNMQLEQIRKQIELLALQAQEIHKRKELSMMIYNAKLSFRPNIGQTYYLYEKRDSSYALSLVSPHEWGNGLPFKQFVSAVKLLADHTWMEL